jgi:hypothetical protein
MGGGQKSAKKGQVVFEWPLRSKFEKGFFVRQTRNVIRFKNNFGVNTRINSKCFTIIKKKKLNLPQHKFSFQRKTPYLF